MTRHLLVTNDFPPKVGGIQSYLAELWHRLDPNSFSVLTATSDDRAAEFDAEWRAQGFDVLRVPSRTLFFPTSRARKAIEAAISSSGAELVLLDPAWPLGLVGPKLSVPYGVVLHGAEVTIPGRLFFLRRSLAKVLRGAAIAIAAGTYPAREGVRAMGHDFERVVNVPPGVDTTRFSPPTPEQRAEVRRSLKISDTTHLVVSISRLVPRKGMDVLIRAAHELHRDGHDLVVAIGGRGRDRKHLERLAKRGPARVDFLDFVADEDLPGILGAADVFAMLCRNRWAGLEQEGFGIVFLEAAACGVAQLAGRSGGSADAVEHGVTGHIVEEPRSVSAVAQALKGLLENPELAEMGRASRLRAEASFSYDHLSSTLGRSLNE
jgi:phosphatidylinositol alpha-1,6-mannosyltransferase